MMNLQELLDEMDVFRKITGIRLQDLYNLMLRRGWTLGSPMLMKGMHGVIRALHSKQVRLLAGYWQRKKAEGNQPDVVVSVIPNFNRALFEAMQQAMPEVPLVTILTDMADYPPHFWIERQPQYLICGTERARSQATRRRPCPGPCISHFGHDSESEISRSRRGRPRSGPHRFGPRSGPAHGA